MFVISHGIKKIPFLQEFIQDRELDRQKIYVGWGRKNSHFKSYQSALKKKASYLCLEDGFIRSLGLGKQGYPPLSLVSDCTGIYFDAYQESDLESLINQPENLRNNFRARACIEQILQCGITKYNQKFEAIDIKIFDQNKKNILIVDQTFGDQSIHYAGANPDTFKQMLTRACQQHPDANILIKTHPDVVAGKAKAHFSQDDLDRSSIQFIAALYNPIELLKGIDEVYVVSSQLGFEALLCGKKVHCFGMPWYAGWGLTDDSCAPIEIVANRRMQQRSLAHLFHQAYINYASYVSPVSGKRCELEEILAILAANIKFQKLLSTSISCYGFSPWKKNFLGDYLGFNRLHLDFISKAPQNKNDLIIAWGKNAKYLKKENYDCILTCEDGFIRSIGLGASLIRPHSLVFDEIGIYYDATAPSKIENLLNTTQLTANQLKRIRDLQKKLVELNISKYNVGKTQQLSRPAHQRVLLVIGQVEDDLSVQLGSAKIKTNVGLLQKVREEHPDSYIIYKPHPDVQAGLRKGQIKENVMLQYANQVEDDAPIMEWFQICDEVHTMTSLAGFEALIRGLKVYCYGMPFYAGWGLTHDLYSCSRRYKSVNLETLLYVTLVEYPVYNLPHTSNFKLPLVRPEDVINHIQDQLDRVGNESMKWYKSLLTPLYKFLKKLG